MKDPGELSELMGLVEACSKHGAAFTSIQSVAMFRLRQAEREAEKEIPRLKEEDRQREAREQAHKVRGAPNERPGPSVSNEPPQTQMRSPQEPILQRPDPSRSIPNEGPTGMQSAANVLQTEDAAGRGREVRPEDRTERTRDLALGMNPQAPQRVYEQREGQRVEVGQREEDRRREETRGVAQNQPDRDEAFRRDAERRRLQERSADQRQEQHRTTQADLLPKTETESSAAPGVPDVDRRV